jgi:type II secretory pathway pseudopilin PulG
MCRAGRKPRPFSFGGTLVELVIALVIIGTLATVVGVSYKSDDTKARYQAERLRTDLRHAQMIAVAQNKTVRITTTVGLGGTYTVTRVSVGSATCTTSALTDPATNASFAVALDSALSLGGGPATPLDFDELGRPSTCTVVSSVCTCALLTSNPSAYTVQGGSTTYTVQVAATSGFASVSP